MSSHARSRVSEADEERSEGGGVRQEPAVACILVTWNNWLHTDRCVRSLLRQEYANLTIIVVDNGSTDSTVQVLRSTYPSVICIENGNNAGFAKACNIGARQGIARGAAYVWFLNNDTEALPDTLTRLVAAAERDPHIGVVGAVLRYTHDPERVQAWGGGSIDLLSGYNRHYTGPAVMGANSYITFASALIRRRTFEELGGLWEEIFLYFEDSDFSLRASRAGWRLAVAEGTAVLHAESATTGRGRRKSPALQRIQTRSGVLFLRRHGRNAWMSVGIFLALRLGRRIVQRDWPGLRAVVQGAADGWGVERARIRRDA